MCDLISVLFADVLGVAVNISDVTEVTTRATNKQVRPRGSFNAKCFQMECPKPTRRSISNLFLVISSSEQCVTRHRGNTYSISRHFTIGQCSSPWPCKFSERRDEFSFRIQALFSLCTIYIAANALNLSVRFEAIPAVSRNWVDLACLPTRRVATKC